MYFFLYKSDQDNQWRWHLCADNGKTIADSAEGYNNKSDALHGINLVKTKSSTSGVFDDTQQKWL